jgi:hypothetical protein
MRVRWIIGAVVAAIALGTADPAAAACQPDKWSGTWEVGSSYKQDGKTIIQTYGNIVFSLNADDDGKVVTGTYSFSGPGGVVNGRLNFACGNVLTGTYKDGTGEGRLEAGLSDAEGSAFAGKYYPCLSGCSSRPFWGRKLF